MNVAQTLVPNLASAENSIENVASPAAPSGEESSFEQVLGASSSNPLVCPQSSILTGQGAEAAAPPTGSVAPPQPNGLVGAPESFPSGRIKIKLVGQSSEAGLMDVLLASEEQPKKKSEKKAEKDLANAAALGVLAAASVLPMLPEGVSPPSETAISSISAVRSRGGAALALHLGLTAEHRLSGKPKSSSLTQVSNPGAESAADNAISPGVNSDQQPGVPSMPQQKLAAIQAASLDSGAIQQSAEPLTVQTGSGASTAPLRVSTAPLNQDLNSSQPIGSPNPSLSDPSILPSQILLPAATGQSADTASIRIVEATGLIGTELSPIERPHEVTSEVKTADQAGTQTVRLNQVEPNRSIARVSRIVSAQSGVFSKPEERPGAAGPTNTGVLIESPKRGLAAGKVAVNVPAKPSKMEGAEGLNVPTAIVQASVVVESAPNQPSVAAQSLSAADPIIEDQGSAPAISDRARPNLTARALVDTPGPQAPGMGRSREVTSRQLLNPLAPNTNNKSDETKLVTGESPSLPVGKPAKIAAELNANSRLQRDVNTSPLLPPRATLTSATIPIPSESTSVPVGKPAKIASEFNANSRLQRDVNTSPLLPPRATLTSATNPIPSESTSLPVGKPAKIASEFNANSRLQRDVNTSPPLPPQATLTSATIPIPSKSTSGLVGKTAKNATEVNAKSDSPGDVNTSQAALRASIIGARPSNHTGPGRTSTESPNTPRRAVKLDGFGPTRLVSGAGGDFTVSVENSLPAINAAEALPAAPGYSLTEPVGPRQKDSNSQELTVIRLIPSSAAESVAPGNHDPMIAMADPNSSDSAIQPGNEPASVIPSNGATIPALGIQGESQKSNLQQSRSDASSELGKVSENVVNALAINDRLATKSDLTVLALDPSANTRNDRLQMEASRARGIFERGSVRIHSAERSGVEGTAAPKGSNVSGILDAQQKPDMFLTAHHEQETDAIRKNIPVRGGNVPDAEQILPPDGLDRSNTVATESAPTVDTLLRLNPASLVDARRMERHSGALADERITGLHRQVADGIWSAVETFRATGPQDWIIRIKPDTGTDLNLRLRMQDNQLVIHARLESGNWDAVAPKWGELQNALSQRGVELRPLESAVERTSLGTNVGQFGSSQQESRHQRFGTDLEEFFESAPPVPQAPIRRERTAASVSSGQGRKLESWA